MVETKSEIQATVSSDFLQPKVTTVRCKQQFGCAVAEDDNSEMQATVSPVRIFAAAEDDSEGMVFGTATCLIPHAAFMDNQNTTQSNH